LNIITEDGEELFLPVDSHIRFWEHDAAYQDQPIFTFKLWIPEKYNISEGSEILLTYYYHKESLEYYAQYRDILSGSDQYAFIITHQNGSIIPTYEVLDSIDDNTITFTEDMKDYLAIGQTFTIDYEFKTRGGLLESKHLFIEVQPYEMTFYNSYNILSGGSIIAPLYYNLSSNFNYQLALNYRLMEKGIHTYQVLVNNTSQEQIDIAYNEVLMYGAEPIIFAHYYNDADEKVWIDETQHISYNSQSHVITIDTAYYLTQITQADRLKKGDTIYVQLASELHNKYRHYHDFTMNLRTDDITLHDWELSHDTSEYLTANFESAHFIYNVQKDEDAAPGKVSQLYALLDDTK
jgi:hypothetical protein